MKNEIEFHIGDLVELPDHFLHYYPQHFEDVEIFRVRYEPQIGKKPIMIDCVAHKGLSATKERDYEINQDHLVRYPKEVLAQLLYHCPNLRSKYFILISAETRGYIPLSSGSSMLARDWIARSPVWRVDASLFQTL